ncbi:MAG TPA: hypothetical protein VE968_09020 [Sphingomicrobium sp.]|nr:hypothetical protein [Sphingomicrobium sp.]
MHYVRPSIAGHPMRFGRAPARLVDPAAVSPSTIVADLRLFAAAFVAGFLFVSILFA